MNFRGTWVTTGLVVALAGYTAWEFRNASKDLDEANGEKIAFGLKREDVKTLEITEGGATSVFEKNGEDWQMTKPVRDLGEATSIEGYLFQTLATRVKAFLPPGEAKSADPKKYGLDPARVTIAIADAKGKRESIAISTTNAFDGSYYVKSGDEVWLGDRGLAQLAERAPSSLRSRRLWRETESSITSAEVKLGPASFTLKRDGGKFAMVPPPSFAIDPERVQRWVDALQEFVPSDFVKEDPTADDLNTYFLKKPGFVVTLAYKTKRGEEKTWTLTVGQDRGDGVYVYSSTRPTLYKATKAAADKVRVDPSYFRDGHAPFLFDVEDAREVRWKNATFKKTDGNWIASGGVDADSELDSEKLVQLIQNVRSLEAQEFPTVAKGVPRTPQVEIRGEGGKPLLRLGWGDEFKATSPWNNGLVFRYVSANGAQTLGVLKDRLAAIDNAGLIRKKKK